MLLYHYHNNKIQFINFGGSSNFGLPGDPRVAQAQTFRRLPRDVETLLICNYLIKESTSAYLGKQLQLRSDRDWPTYSRHNEPQVKSARATEHVPLTFSCRACVVRATAAAVLFVLSFWHRPGYARVVPVLHSASVSNRITHQPTRTTGMTPDPPLKSPADGVPG